MSSTQFRQRAQLLRALSKITSVLINRFGRQSSLAMVRVVLEGHLALLLEEQLTITDLAERTGTSKQSISRWLNRYAPFVSMEDNPSDARSKLIKPVDLDGMLAYLEEFMRILEAEMTPRLMDGEHNPT